MPEAKTKRPRTPRDRAQARKRLTPAKQQRGLDAGEIVLEIAAAEIQDLAAQVQGAGGYLSQSSRTVHFGLGERDRIDRVEVHWPATLKEKPQVIMGPAINKLHTYTEPSE